MEYARIRKKATPKCLIELTVSKATTNSPVPSGSCSAGGLHVVLSIRQLRANAYTMETLFDELHQ